MKKYARIENNVVKEVLTIEDTQDITKMFHPSIVWLEATEACVQGWLLHDNALVPPDNYKRMRAISYPPIEALIDGLVKANSEDPAIKAEGNAQITAYTTQCLEIKALYPKPL